MLISFILVFVKGHLLEDQATFGLREKGVKYSWGFESLCENILTLCSWIRRNFSISCEYRWEPGGSEVKHTPAGGVVRGSDRVWSAVFDWVVIWSAEAISRSLMK